MQAGSARLGNRGASPQEVGCWDRGRNRVLADDLATRVDAVGERSAHAWSRKIETGVMPVCEQESMLSAAGDIKANDVGRAR